MNEEISNSRIQRILRQKIAQNPKDVALMKSILYCGSRVIHQLTMSPTVFVLANHDDAKFFGMTSCKNTWVCPVCSARVMSKYAAEIAVAIDALKARFNQVACMITFTVPHTSSMSCDETTEILFNSWKDFITHGNKNQNAKYYANADNKWKHGQRKKMVVSDKKLNDPFAAFCETFNCKHRVRVGEYTWGEHGWHPHFHCLFWVDADKLQQVADWQEKLNERWYELTQRHTVRQWNKRFPDKKDDNRTRARIMYEKMDKDGSNGIYISVDADGKVIEQKSSSYICGWGADRELTGNYKQKASNKGHFTPRQLLEKYDETHDEKWLDIFMEMARTTRLKKRRRVMFSTQSGIKKIIADWKKTHVYIESMKKKASELLANRGAWTTVFWFNEQQWSDICWIDRTTNIKTEILELARAPDAADQIIKFLAQHDIDVSKNKKPHRHSLFIESICNHAC